MSARRFPFLAPTGNSFALAAVSLAVWYAAASQNNGPAYLLLFALGAIFAVSLPHTLLNLGRLKVRAEAPKPVFAGQDATLALEITNPSRRARFALRLLLGAWPHEAEVVPEIAAGKSARATLRFPTTQRGEHPLGTILVNTVYPFGFLRAAQRFPLAQQLLVYPTPAGERTLPAGRSQAADRRPPPELGAGDDFAGVRAYLPGESQRHIDWKAVARGQALMTKQFAVEAQGALHFDFENLCATDPETRLSQLALWAIEAERAGRPFSLRLPGAQIAAGLGSAHLHRALRALALFQK